MIVDSCVNLIPDRGSSPRDARPYEREPHRQRDVAQAPRRSVQAESADRESVYRVTDSDSQFPTKHPQDQLQHEEKMNM